MTRAAPDWGAGERRLIWIEGSAGACAAAARQCLARLAAADVAWVGEAPPQAVAACRPGQASRRLGVDLAAAVLDAHSGLDPDDLGAVGGAVRGDGALLLLTPPACEWPLLADPAAHRLASHGCPPERFAGRFRQRLVSLLRSHRAVLRAPAGTTLPALAPPRWRPPAVAPDPECLTMDQAAAVAAIQAMPQADPPAPLLLTADRGRGKSAALGIAARRLLAAGNPVTVTAPSFRTTATLFRHARPRHPSFAPPESAAPEGGVLLVDEAAALPLPRLQALVASHPRAVLATTVHGYEGSGHGVTLRLAQALAEAYPGMRTRHLRSPVRWAADDPLEDFLTRALLLDAEPARLPTPPTESRTVGAITAAALSADEPRLTATFGLLVAGHYQTRPRDLRQLLDDPEVRLWLALEEQRVIGVLAARPEGGFPAPLARAVWLGERRPRGHLMAQSLACHAGIPDAAAYRGLRVLRIAVHPERRRRGVGGALLAAAAAGARADSQDWLGASFGGTAGLLAFWEAHGFTPVRLGNRPDAASGSHAIMVLHPLSASGRMLQDEARRRLARHLPVQRRHAGAALDPDLAALLERRLPPPTPEATDPDDVEAFAFGHRRLLDARPALGALLADRAHWRGLEARDQALLQGALDHPGDVPAIARDAGFSGRREALRRLRTLVAGMLQERDGGVP